MNKHVRAPQHDRLLNLMLHHLMLGWVGVGILTIMSLAPQHDCLLNLMLRRLMLGWGVVICFFNSSHARATMKKDHVLLLT